MADRRIWEVVEFVGTPKGHIVQAVTSAAPLSSIPVGANRVIIRTKANGISWTDDAQTPSASLGMYLLADETLVYDGDLSAFQLAALSGTADVRIAYYTR